MPANIDVFAIVFAAAAMATPLFADVMLRR